MKLVLDLIDKLNYKFGIIFFKNSNLLTFNLYRYFYKKKICNLKYLETDFINSFHNNGYAKLGKVNLSSLSDLKNLLNIQNPSDNDNHHIEYKITPDIYNVIKKIIQTQLSDKLEVLEKYYNQKIVLAFLTISRNYPSSKKDESYSNFFHTDAYVYNMFKIFINLNDVSEKNGPLTLVKKRYNKEFLNKFNYKDRKSYKSNLDNNDDLFFKNTGKAGDVFLCSTTELFHRAGDPYPGEFRDMIFLNFVAQPTKSKNIIVLEYEDLTHKDDVLIKKLSKIRGLKNLIRFYCKNFKEKLI